LLAKRSLYVHVDNLFLGSDQVVSNGQHIQVHQVIHALQLGDTIIEQRQVCQFGKTFQAFNLANIVEGQVWRVAVLM
jgi:hypothetical protein